MLKQLEELERRRAAAMAEHGQGAMAALPPPPSLISGCSRTYRLIQMAHGQKCLLGKFLSPFQPEIIK